MDWLEKETGYSLEWWFRFVQESVVKNSSPSEDPKHDETDTRKVIEALTSLVCNCPPMSGRYDENMRVAMLLSFILGSWFVKICKGKSLDPKRPLQDRARGYKRVSDFVGEFLRGCLDDRDLPLLLGQEFELPGPRGRDGSFR